MVRRRAMTTGIPKYYVKSKRRLRGVVQKPEESEQHQNQNYVSQWKWTIQMKHQEGRRAAIKTTNNEHKQNRTEDKNSHEIGLARTK